MNSPKDSEARGRAWPNREAFRSTDNITEIHARWRNGPEHANSLKQSPQAVVEKLSGDTAKLQKMLAKLYPELARLQQMTTSIHA